MGRVPTRLERTGRLIFPDPLDPTDRGNKEKTGDEVLQGVE